MFDEDITFQRGEYWRLNSLIKLRLTPLTLDVNWFDWRFGSPATLLSAHCKLIKRFGRFRLQSSKEPLLKRRFRNQLTFWFCKLMFASIH